MENIKELIRQDIKALSEEKEKEIINKTALIREMFEDIEHAKKKGVSLDSICKALEKREVYITKKQLTPIMTQIRKERGISRKQKKESIVTESEKQESSNTYDYREHLEKNDKYSHIPRFEINEGVIDYYKEGDLNEQYYSLGCNPDDGFSKKSDHEKKRLLRQRKSKILDDQSLYSNKRR
ncbi:hypothetical protein AB832_08385 [Flavobacteriaceae bacterium (ex Bugula neritina AB1)]|jgi:hypothetical protein|nr:hypothetical protein AB832_08385 [Flavobacteriaceae bacterium (ex Bugula neritina AB1)]